MSLESASIEKFDDTILSPSEWNEYPLHTILKKMIKIKLKGKPCIPVYFSKGQKTWNNFNVDQKKKMITAWSFISSSDREIVLADANRKLGLSNAADTWNQDDWSRLIHIYSDVKLITTWTRINSVSTVLYSLCTSHDI